jgi:hypothetical protein
LGSKEVAVGQGKTKRKKCVKREMKKSREKGWR